MKSFLLRVLLLYRTKDQGFTLPIVVGIGLIMLLLGSISIVQSSEENLSAISKDESSSSLAMAELGVARYRELLNNNRILAVYSLNGPQGWKTANMSEQTCDDITGVGGWADDTSWRPIQFDENAYNLDFNDDGDTTDLDVPVGSYRIVDYIYQNNANPGDGNFDQSDDVANRTDPLDPDTGPIGILTVQGRKNNGGVAQIQVSIPIGVNTDDLTSLDPGIWINQDSEDVIAFGDLTLQKGNLVLYRDSASDGCSAVDVGLAENAIRDSRHLPPLATIPHPNSSSNPIVPAGKFNDLESTTDIGDDARFGTIVPNQLILGTLADNQNSGEDLNGDDKINGDLINDIYDYLGNDRYYYEVNGNLTINDGQDLITDGTAKVIVVVNGNLNIDGNVSLSNSSDDATSRYLEIHVTGNVNISGSGLVDIKGLIHAPNGTVNITGSPDVDITGSIWANNWNNASGDVDVDSGGDADTDEYQFYSVTNERTPRPLTYAPTQWLRQEAN